MTEAGNKWALSKPYTIKDATCQRAAEFWIRDFCAEIDKEADFCFSSGGCSNREEAVGIVYDELKRKLLGDQP